MNDGIQTDWWLWQMYRQVATYVHQPTADNERRLRKLLQDYRLQDDRRASRSPSDAPSS